MTQTNKILEHLLTGEELTPLEALEKFGCFRLAARVYDLRKEGIDIQERIVHSPTGKHWAADRLGFAHG